MKPCLVSLGVGVLVGIIYALMNVRSPAPPVIALAGLLGILIGEQAVPLVKRLIWNHVSEAAVGAARPDQMSTLHGDRNRPSDRDA
jgi:XapX domain-containing protein